MAEFSAKDVAELRKQTGCGMMDCKNALKDANGDFEGAMKILREKGMAATAKKASRIAAEGIVDIMTEGNVTAIVEVNSETDFVAKNAVFQEFVKDILKAIIANKPADVDALLESKMGDTLVKDVLAEMTYKIGEKLSIRRFEIVEGTVSTYIHGMGATGVIVSFNTDLADKAEFAECAKNVALQTAAMPVQYLNREAVPASVLAEEKEILIKQMEQDPKMANKPRQVLEKIVEGRLGKFFENNCLLDQLYVKDDSMTVAKYVASVAKALGGNITVTGYIRFDKGEGLQKREEDFAAEIEKMVKG
ncbi:MAG: translation elongation factor Ts [Clostridia bacterium]|nr:translation elongation factor Ts [Clostridia bacterium]